MATLASPRSAIAGAGSYQAGSGYSTCGMFDWPVLQVSTSRDGPQTELAKAAELRHCSWSTANRQTRAR